MCLDGTKLVTLRQAAQFILKLPRAERGVREWRTAMRILIEAADQGGPITSARMAMMKALYPYQVVESDSSQTNWPSLRRKWAGR